MRNWNYKELKQTINEAYYDQLDQNQTKEQSIALVFEDFYFYPEEENVIENLIITIETTIIFIREFGYLRQKRVDFLKQYLAHVTDELLSIELSEEERKAFDSDISYVLNKLNTIDIRSVDDVS